MTRALKDADYSRLTPQSQATKILIGERLTEGYNQTELAEKLGRPPSWVAERLQSLRNELLLQAGLFFPLTDDEIAALTWSIERNGVRSPVVIGQHIACIDGRHRLLIAAELGLETVPAIFLTDLDEEQEREISIGLNAARRQLTRAQKRSIVENELMRDPGRSDRLIASIAGVHWDTVGEIRREIEAQLAIIVQPELSETATVMPPNRVGRDGRSQPTRTPAPTAPRPAPEPGAERHTELPETLVGYAPCSHGDRHAVWTDTRYAGRYRLENVQV